MRTSKGIRPNCPPFPHRRRLGRQPRWSPLPLLLIALSCFPSSHRHHYYCCCLAKEDEDFLAEILAKEAKHDEEHARLEAEMKEMEAMHAARQQQQ
eukprot:CCRYP_001480-RA/>CCRYP_001480-RA protein AED:0.74 eAED:0.35 QI:0/-1/0/1/-1/1/1/0/95